MSFGFSYGDILALRKSVCKLQIAIHETVNADKLAPALSKDLYRLEATISQITKLDLDASKEKKTYLPIQLDSCKIDIENLLQEVQSWQSYKQNNANKNFGTGVDMNPMVPGLDEAQIERIRVSLLQRTVLIKTLLELLHTDGKSSHLLVRERLSDVDSGEKCSICNEKWTYPPMNVDLLPSKPAKTRDEMNENTDRIHLFTTNYLADKQADFERWKLRHRHHKAIISERDMEVEVARELRQKFEEDEILWPMIQQARRTPGIFRANFIRHFEEQLVQYGKDLSRDVGDNITRQVARIVESKAQILSQATIEDLPVESLKLDGTGDHDKSSEGRIGIMNSLEFEYFIKTDMEKSEAWLLFRERIVNFKISSERPAIKEDETIYRNNSENATTDISMALLEPVWPGEKSEEAWGQYFDDLRQKQPKTMALLAFMSVLKSRAIPGNWLSPYDEPDTSNLIVATGFAERDIEKQSDYNMDPSAQSLVKTWLKSKDLFVATLHNAVIRVRDLFTHMNDMNEHDQKKIIVYLSHAQHLRMQLSVEMSGKEQSFRPLGELLLDMDRQWATIKSYREAVENFQPWHWYMSRYFPDLDQNFLLTEAIGSIYDHISGKKEAAVTPLERLTPIIKDILVNTNSPHLDVLERFRRLNDHINGDDGVSVISTMNTEFTGTTLVDAYKDTMDVLVNHFTTSLISDKVIESLLKTLLSKSDMTRSRLQNNIRRLLNHLAGDLRFENSDHETRALRQFIAVNSPRISTSILKVVGGGKELVGLPSMSLSSKQKTIAFLDSQGLLNVECNPGENVPDAGTEESDDDFEEDAHDAIEERSLSDDLTKQLSDIMESISDRFVRSLAYHNFRLRIHGLAYPTVASRVSNLIERWSRPEDQNHELISRYQLKELVANLEDVASRDIFLNEPVNSFRRSLTSYQRNIEEFTRTRWDWWPLPPPLAPVKKGESRLRWKCTCGEARHAVIPNGFALRLQTYAAASSSPPVSPPHMAQIPQSHQSKPSTSSGGSKTGSGQSAPTSQHIPMLNVQGIPKFTSSRQFDNMRIILMVKRGDEYGLSQIGLQQLDCHGFFSSLRREYFNLRGFVRGWFSVWRYSHCDFYTCEKFSERYFTPKKKDSFPIPTNDDYDYDKPLDSIPPIQDHEFRVRFYACHKRNPIRHFWHKCKKLGGHSNDVLGLFPKKKTELEEAGDKREEFWGVFARERPSLRWILIYNFLCLAPMLGFFIARAIQLPSDLQNPAVPFTFMLGTLSMFWSIFIGTHDFGRSI